MIIGSCIITFRAEWVCSLKEKRMIIKSITEKAKNKFNISIAEVGKQDMHKEIEIGFCCVTNEVSHANSIIDNVVNFMENNTDAVIENIEFEIL